MAQSLALQIAGTYTDTVSGITQNKTWSNNFTISGNAPIQHVQNITTGDTTIYLGDMTGTTPGYLFMRSLASVTANIVLGGDGSSYPITVAPTGFGAIQWNATAIHAKTTTLSAQLEYMVIPK
jgi:hypothetical protein